MRVLGSLVLGVLAGVVAALVAASELSMTVVDGVRSGQGLPYVPPAPDPVVSVVRPDLVTLVVIGLVVGLIVFITAVPAWRARPR